MFRLPIHSINVGAVSGCSYARRQLVALGGVGLFASWQNDSVCIIDPATPANNYDGSFAGIFTLVGSPDTGPNGGMLGKSGKLARLITTAFPFDYSIGTIGGEYVRTNASHVAYFGITNLLANAGEYGCFRSAGSIGGLRFSYRDNASFFEPGGSRHYLGLRNVAAGSWESGVYVAATYDGKRVTEAVADSISAPVGDRYFTFGGGVTGGTDQCEILEAWYIPTTRDVDWLDEYTLIRDPRVFSVNSATGDNSNDGISAPKLTIINTLTPTSTPGAGGTNVRLGDIVELAGRFHEVGIALEEHINFRDSGARAVIDGSKAMAAASWAVDGTFTNSYTLAQAQSILTGAHFYPTLFYGDRGTEDDPSGCLSTSSTTLTIGVGAKTIATQAGKAYQAGDLVRVHAVSGSGLSQVKSRTNFMSGLVTSYSGTALEVNVTGVSGSGEFSNWVIDLTTALQYAGTGTLTQRRTFVDANPGWFTTDPVKTSAPSATSTVTYYMNPPDGADPGTSGIQYYFGEQKSVITLAGGESFSGLTVQRCATKDMINATHGNHTTTMTDMRLLDTPGHGVVKAPAVHTSNYARGLEDSVANGGGLFHLFHDEAVDGASPPCSVTSCVAQNGAIGFYSHGTAVDVPNESVAVTDCESADCPTAIQTGGVNGSGVGAWTITNHVRTRSGDYVLDQTPPPGDTLINSP